MGTQQQVITQKTELPAWYSSYLQQVMGRAVGAAGEPYQAYGGQLVAGMTPDQASAADIVRGSAAGAASPWMQAATDQYNQSAAGDSGAAAQPGFDAATGMFNQAAAGNSGAAGAGAFGQATDMFGAAGGVDTGGMYSPYGQQAAALTYGAGQAATPYLQQSTSGLGFNAAQPYLQQSTQPTGLMAASPYLQQAGQTLPGGIADYMSPYTQQVTDRIAQLGARNLSENLLPQISDQFVRSGQYGSPQQRDVIGRALRDTQESVLGQQAQALEQGYGMAGQLFGQDQSRLAGLASTAGGLGTSQQQILQGAGSALGGLGTSQQQLQQGAGTALGNLGLSQASALSNIGSTQAGLYGQDAGRQLQAAQGISNIGQSQIQAAQADYARQLQAAQGMYGIGQAQGQFAAGDFQRQLGAGQGLQSLAQQGQNMSLQNAAALDAVGQGQQAQQQRGLDAAYGQFQEQRNYPWQQIGNMSNVIQGLPVNQSSSSTAQTTSPNPSALSQIAGVGLGAAGLAQSGLFKARGGAVRKHVKYKRSHSYGNTPRRGIAVFEDAA